VFHQSVYLIVQYLRILFVVSVSVASMLVETTTMMSMSIAVAVAMLMLVALQHPAAAEVCQLLF